MTDIKTFYLPDLGEGLPDAEIVEWYVQIGDVAVLDKPLVSMETAKAVVEIPSPYSGKVVKLAGKAGDVVLTGAALIEIELDQSLPQRADAQDTGHHHAVPAEPTHLPPSPSVIPEVEGSGEAEGGDAGTVVGAMESSNAVRSEQAIAIGGVKAMPAVRALAKKLKVDLTRVSASGAEGVITLTDVKNAAANPPAFAYSPTPQAPLPLREAGTRSVLGAGVAHAPVAFDKEEPIRGVRRNMLRTMSAAHAEVVPTTLMDDADLNAWSAGEDITVRTIRALATAAKFEPALNAWLNAKEGSLRRHSAVHIGIAVDSPDGLFVPSLKHCDTRDAMQIRSELNRLRDGVKTRSLPPEELSGYTLMFSNFGVFAGKYATPVVVPPCVCIVGTGRLYHGIVPVLGGMETHRMMPISLTFDHRAATGGEAARFLKAMIDDLQRAR